MYNREWGICEWHVRPHIRVILQIPELIRVLPCCCHTNNMAPEYLILSLRRLDMQGIFQHCA